MGRQPRPPHSDPSHVAHRLDGHLPLYATLARKPSEPCRLHATLARKPRRQPRPVPAPSACAGPWSIPHTLFPHPPPPPATQAGHGVAGAGSPPPETRPRPASDPRLVPPPADSRPSRRQDRGSRRRRISESRLSESIRVTTRRRRRRPAATALTGQVQAASAVPGHPHAPGGPSTRPQAQARASIAPSPVNASWSNTKGQIETPTVKQKYTSPHIMLK